MNEFGPFLRQRRLALGLSQRELGERLGVTNKTISKWETGRTFPETSLLPTLSDVLGVAVDELLRGQRIQKESSGAALPKIRWVSIVLGLFSVAVGVTSLLLMRAAGFSYLYYLPLLFACIGVCVFLLLYEALTQLFHKKQLPKASKKWVFLLPLSVCLLLLAPLILILGHALLFAAPSYLAVFFPVLILGALLFLLSMWKWVSYGKK